MTKQQFLDYDGLKIVVDEILGRIRENGKVESFANGLIDFPTIGKENVVYIDELQNAVYRWDDENIKYYCVGKDYEKIDIILGGDSVI